MIMPKSKKLNSINVMLVDDHEIVRQGLAAALESEDDIIIVGEANSKNQAIKVALNCQPHVILMDVRLPDGTGIEACREILEQSPDIQVLMLTSYQDDDAVFAAIIAGAAGYLLKEVSSQAIINGIRTVADGGSLLDPKVTGKIFKRLRHQPSEKESKLASLNKRERNILELIAKGKTNKEIAELILLSDKTVKNYVSIILSKLQLSRRSAAASFVTELKNH